jgi:predicted transcriptional regulator YdeE
LYSVYFEYETDHMGYYTALLGCKVAPKALIPERFKKIDIPEGEYLIHTLSGEIPKIVGEAWQEIWEFGNNRTYTFDFDRYIRGLGNITPEVRIYVAV